VVGSVLIRTSVFKDKSITPLIPVDTGVQDENVMFFVPVAAQVGMRGAGWRDEFREKVELLKLLDAGVRDVESRVRKSLARIARTSQCDEIGDVTAVGSLFVRASGTEDRCESAEEASSVE